jgi:hypothetical protein
MEEFGSSEGLRHNNNQTPSGSLDAPRKATLNTYRNDQGSSRTSGSFQSHESKISAETTDAGDQAGARQAGTEQNVSSSISDSRQPAYPSYAAYLREIKETRPQYEDLWGCLDWKYDGRYPGAFRILIADSGKDGIRGNIWASARNSMRGLPVDETLRDRVIGQITTPPKGDVHVRIIVLELELGQQASSRDIVDAIGRTYDINPAFLNAFFCYNRNRLDVSPRRSARSPLPQRKSFLRFHGFFVGQVMDRQRSSGVAMKIGKSVISTK